MRFNTAALIAAGAAMFVVGCGNNGGGETASSTTGGSSATTGGSGDKGGKLTIAVIPKGSTHEYWKSVHAGADAAGKELGAEIVFKGPVKEDDKNGQVDVVQQMISQGVSGIVLAPLDDTALAPAVKEAEKANIPVLIIDSDLKGADIVSFVATDNEKGGQMAADALAKSLGEKGNVIMIRYQEGSASTALREKGFSEEIAKYPNIKVVSDNQYAGATVEEARTKGESVLAGLKKPDGSLSIDGLYTPNESSTFGLLRVLEDNKWAGKIKFVGFDSSPSLVKGLEAGEIDGLIVQNPIRMGHDGVKTLVDYIKGNKNVEKRIDTGATLVTKANMAQPDIAKLIQPVGQ